MQTGDIVGDYRVIALAGSGGMGDVYKIEHVITKRIEAMKVLPIGIASGAEAVQRFEREIEVQARLHHPNIVSVYNAVRDDRSIALIMEYVEGEALQRLLDKGKLPLRTAIDYAGQVLGALAYAHQKGVIHRDVASANIIITSDGTAKLADFGLALAVTDLRVTAPGVALGSAWYMAPEQVRAEQPDARADIYAMGAVLHEMLTGRKLFDVDGSFSVMRAQMETIPQLPSAHNPEIPAALDEVVAKALAKDPSARFQSAGEFHTALESAKASVRAAASAIKPAPKWMPRASQGPWRVAAVLVLTSAFAAVAGVLLLSNRTARVGTSSGMAQEVVTAKPAAVALPQPAAEPIPPEAAPADAAAAPPPEIPVEEVKPETRSAASFSTRPARKRTNVIRDSGRTGEPATLAPKPPLRVPAREPKSDVTASSELTPAPAGAQTSTEGQVVTPAPEAAKPAKSGNRFLRALGKLNPFHKSNKNDAADPAKGAASEDVVK
jgi:serine/threonine protein kinase